MSGCIHLAAFSRFCCSTVPQFPGAGRLQPELGRRVLVVSCGLAPKWLLYKAPANSDSRLNSPLVIFRALTRVPSSSEIT